jgi:DNA-binding beta-propeller fold protein YncE
VPTRFPVQTLGGALLALGLSAGCALAQSPDCNQSAKDAIVSIALPGAPVAVASSADGCAIYVAIPARGADPGRIAVVTRKGGAAALARVITTPGSAVGLALSPDGKALAVATGAGAALFDTRRILADLQEPLITLFDEGPKAGSAAVAFSRDGVRLFISDQGSNTLGVWDVAARKRLAGLPIGQFPGGLVLSPDGQRLYVVDRFVEGHEADCSSPDGQASWTAPGELAVVDVAKMAVAQRIPAGCGPARAALSPDGALAYVTVQGDDTVLALHASGAPGPVQVKAGAAPGGIVATARAVLVLNADREIAVLKPDATARMGAIPLDGLPHDAALTADGSALLVVDMGADSLKIVDLARLGELMK